MERYCCWCENVVDIDPRDIQIREGMELWQCPKCGLYNEQEQVNDDRV